MTRRDEVVQSVLVGFRSEVVARKMLGYAAHLGVAEQVRTAVSADEVLGRLVESPADIVLANSGIADPDGASFTRRVRSYSADASVVLVGVTHPRAVTAAIAAGAYGVIGPPGGDQLVAACAQGLLVMQARRNGFAEIPRPRVPDDGPKLSTREIQVLRAMSDGCSNAEIGRRLFISEDTVKTHARRLYRKLGARDRAHAVAAAFRAGLVC